MSYLNGTLLSSSSAWHNDATVQPGLESSNQAFEYVKSLLKALEIENLSLQLWKY